jgi:hypothetical protein
MRTRIIKALASAGILALLSMPANATDFDRWTSVNVDHRNYGHYDRSPRYRHWGHARGYYPQRYYAPHRFQRHAPRYRYDGRYDRFPGYRSRPYWRDDGRRDRGWQDRDHDRNRDRDRGRRARGHDRDG